MDSCLLNMILLMLPMLPDSCILQGVALLPTLVTIPSLQSPTSLLAYAWHTRHATADSRAHAQHLSKTVRLFAGPCRLCLGRLFMPAEDVLVGQSLFVTAHIEDVVVGLRLFVTAHML